MGKGEEGGGRGERGGGRGGRGREWKEDDACAHTQRRHGSQRRSRTRPQSRTSSKGLAGRRRGQAGKSSGGGCQVVAICSAPPRGHYSGKVGGAEGGRQRVSHRRIRQRHTRPERCGTAGTGRTGLPGARRRHTAPSRTRSGAPLRPIHAAAGMTQGGCWYVWNMRELRRRGLLAASPSISPPPPTAPLCQPPLRAGRRARRGRGPAHTPPRHLSRGVGATVRAGSRRPAARRPPPARELDWWLPRWGGGLGPISACADAPLRAQFGGGRGAERAWVWGPARGRTSFRGTIKFSHEIPFELQQSSTFIDERNNFRRHPRAAPGHSPTSLPHLRADAPPAPDNEQRSPRRPVWLPRAVVATRRAGRPFPISPLCNPAGSGLRVRLFRSAS